MKTVRFIFIGLVIIFISLSGIALLLPSEITVSRSIEINAPLPKVSGEIIHLENWNHWNPQFQERGILLPANVSASKNSIALKNNSGRIVFFTIGRINKDTINVDLISDNDPVSEYQFIVSGLRNETLVTWNVNMKLGWYPWRKVQGIVMDKFIGPSYETALQSLKKYVE